MKAKIPAAERSSRLALICVTCPMGCALDVTVKDGKVTSVEGQACKRGLAYAQDEITDPRRVVTTTVRVQGGLHSLLPVHTAEAFPKDRIFDLLQELRQVTVTAPVCVDQVVLKDALGTSTDVLSSRDMPEEK